MVVVFLFLCTKTHKVIRNAIVKRKVNRAPRIIYEDVVVRCGRDALQRRKEARRHLHCVLFWS